MHEFATRPYDEVSAGEIADMAKVAHGLVFRYFGNKRGLYLAVVREVSERLFDVAPSDPSFAPGVQLRDVLRRHFLRVAENEHLLLGYARGAIVMSADPLAWEMLERLRLRLVDWTCDAIGIPRDHPAIRLMMRTAGNALDELSVAWLQQGRQFEVDQVVEAMVHVVTGSLAAAHSLDPNLDIDSGIALLAEPGG